MLCRKIIFTLKIITCTIYIKIIIGSENKIKAELNRFYRDHFHMPYLHRSLRSNRYTIVFIAGEFILHK